MRRRALLLAALLCAGAPALAQERPPLQPTRDVAVTYRFLQGMPQGGPASMTMAWHAETGRLRTDMPGMGWMVADQRAGRAFMVMEQMRMVMDVPAQEGALERMQPSPRATFRREGTATVAGHPCTIWHYRDGASEGRACITADGVMLRAEGTHEGQRGGMEATQVAYGRQDPARFQRPQGYQTMQMPQGMPPGMMRPPGR